MVEKVLDGDTIEVLLNGDIHVVRYIGINAPEQEALFGPEALEINQQFVAGQQVRLVRDVSNIDNYDRLLRYVFLEDGTFVNAELIKLGCARVKIYPPDIQYQDLFLELESAASAAELGLWKKTAGNAAAPVAETEIVFDPACAQINAPGDATQNKVKAYVCFTNHGVEIINLSHWSMTDEFGWTYEFKPFSLDGGASVRIRTGCGIDTEQDLFWCQDGTSVWNNDADCVILKDPQGHEAVRYCY